MLRRRPLSVDLLEDLGHLSFDKGFPGGDSDGIIGETELLVNTAAFGADYSSLTLQRGLSFQIARDPPEIETAFPLLSNASIWALIPER